MRKYLKQSYIAVFIILCFLLPSLSPAMEMKNQVNNDSHSDSEQILIDATFSDASYETHNDRIIVRVPETNYNKMTPGHPVVPAYIETINLPFGSEIINVTFTNSTAEIIPIHGVLASGSLPGIDDYPINEAKTLDPRVYAQDSLYPGEWISYHTGGGLDFSEHVTFFTLRIYPVQYNPIQNHIKFIRNISVKITYQPPENPLLTDSNIYDLLVIAPEKYHDDLQPLITHKQDYDAKTNLVGIDEIVERMFWQGRDTAEKIKYFIKKSVEEWGISHVLLVGGLQGQKSTWDLPVRYSHVVPPTEQEYAEQSFISDLYYADIYDAQGGFSSWDSNKDDFFSEWNEDFKEDMDLYPDVYLGRLPARNSFEVKTMVRKIIQYESSRADESWFHNLVLVAGDSYVNNGEEDFNEGEIMAEKTIELMPNFTPLKVYASMNDINRKTVNSAMNQGAGFAFFCGHGSASSWSTHFPPATSDQDNWTTGYEVEDMMFLRNKEKLPITVVGGCHNGQFDITIPNSIKQGLQNYGLKYFLGRFFFDGWVPKCWAWWLTSAPRGGAIATIANTGLGTHGEEDSDYNGVIDYLEVLDGWMELRFLELYGLYQEDDLGENHGQTMTEYLHRFLGDEEKMDTKMVQQWELFGDPSLRIKGYIS